MLGCQSAAQGYGCGARRIYGGCATAYLLRPEAAAGMVALRSRGKDDCLGSKDIGDIVIVLDRREELAEEVAGSDPDVRQFIMGEFCVLLEDEHFRAALPAHMLPEEASQARAALVLARMHKIAGMHI